MSPVIPGFLFCFVYKENAVFNDPYRNGGRSSDSVRIIFYESGDELDRGDTDFVPLSG